MLCPNACNNQWEEPTGDTTCVDHIAIADPWVNENMISESFPLEESCAYKPNRQDGREGGYVLLLGLDSYDQIEGEVLATPNMQGQSC